MSQCRAPLPMHKALLNGIGSCFLILSYGGTSHKMNMIWGQQLVYLRGAAVYSRRQARFCWHAEILELVGVFFFFFQSFSSIPFRPFCRDIGVMHNEVTS